MTFPVDERLRSTPMVPVRCRECAAQVLVRKSSWAQTSIQWNAAATAACTERNSAPTAAGASLPQCSQLYESIADAVRSGELPVLDEDTAR